MADRTVGVIGRGLLLLVGVDRSDTEADVRAAAGKVAGLRVFGDGAGQMNLGLTDVDGSVLAVSQFTLLGEARKGRRPSFTHAAPPEQAVELFNLFVADLRDRGLSVETGLFGEVMEVRLVNEGPVTLIIETREGRVI